MPPAPHRAAAPRTDEVAHGLRYLPALDGVRALSLLAVLLYHAGYHWARGGYLGVTVFFTLSGFLITSLLLQERRATGTVRLRSFWQRRAQRLVPGVLVLLGLVVAYLALAGHVRPRGVVGDAIATATWVANWRFILNGDSYATLFSDPSPFQHMWSLAVEEQFYLLFPGLLLLILGRRAMGRRFLLGAVLLMGVIASTAACAALVHHGMTTRSYYGTDTRVAEPLVGALLALLLLRGTALRQLGKPARLALDLLAVAAVAGLVLLVHGLGEYDPRLYRGGFLLTAVLAAVVVAAASQPGGLVARLLALPPLVGIGRISYGGYLYHWPLFLWITTARTGLTGTSLLSARLLATLGLATASYWLVESPVRRQRSLQVGAALVGWAGASVALVASVVVVSMAVPVVIAPADALAPPPPVPQVISSPARHAPVPTAVRARASHRQAAGRPSPSATASRAAVRPVARKHDTFGFNAGPSGPGAVPVSNPGPSALRIAVVGDSLANNLANGLIAWAKNRKDVVVYNLATPGCPLAPGGTRRWPDGYNAPVSPECGWWQDESDQRTINLRTFDPDVIVIQDAINESVDRKLDSWPTYQKPGDVLYDEWLRQQYDSVFQALNPNGTARLVLLNAVCGDWNNVNHLQGAAADYDQRVDAMNSLYAGIGTSSTLEQLDLLDNVCPGGKFSSTVDGVSDARPDGYHLSDAAGLAVATTWLGPLVMKADPRPTS